MGGIESKVNVDAIKKEVAANPIVVYKKPGCQFCDKARTLLQEAKLTPKEVDLERLKTENPKEGAAIVNGLVYTTRYTAVPQIFICGKFIGGYTELKQLQDSGRLLEEVLQCSSE